MTEQEYISKRIDNQIAWYSSRASINKRLNHWFKGSIIVFSSAIPLVAGIEMFSQTKNILLAILGSLISIFSGVSGLLKFQEKWTEYRTTSETLKHEKILFQTKTGPYNVQRDPFKELVTRIENLVSKENSLWSQYINKQNL